METMFKPLSRPWAGGSFGMLAAISIAVLAWSVNSPAQETRKSGKGLSTTSLPALKTRVAFPNLKFDRPVAFAFPDDGSNLLFVADQHAAKVWSFPDERTTSDKKLFLELPDPINRGNEEGLLGLTFHPKYRENKQFFVYYSANDQGKRRSVVSRFKASSADPRMADPASEERIWVSAEDPFENHNGGHIAFGPDGYLYITLGDGGAADDPLSSGQKANDWFGSILRIDVDHPDDGKAYGIPKDNPSRRGGKFATRAPRFIASACAMSGNSALTGRPENSGRETLVRTYGKWSTRSTTAETTAGAYGRASMHFSPSAASVRTRRRRSDRRSSSIPTRPRRTVRTRD
jgi:hypothetical protein